MKVNSNTIKLEKESYESLENIIKKIASENKINNIKNVEIKFSKDSGVVCFKKANDEECSNWETKAMINAILNDDKVYGEMEEMPGYFEGVESFVKLIKHVMPHGAPELDGDDYNRVRWDEVFYVILDVLNGDKPRDFKC